MNIHLPAILGFTKCQGFDPSPSHEIHMRHGSNYLGKYDWGMMRLRTFGPSDLDPVPRQAFLKRAVDEVTV